MKGKYLFSAMASMVLAAAALGSVNGEWQVNRLKGASTVETHKSATQDAAWKACVDAIAKQPAGATIYTCQTPRYVATVAADPTCSAAPASQTRTQTCPTGTKGTWTQTLGWVNAPYPTCWTSGAWSPTDAPAGACTPVVTAPTGDIAAGLPLLTNKAIPMPALAKPAKGVWFQDPTTKVRMMRITDAAEGAIVIPAYGTIPAWNADESMLILYRQGGGHLLFDGKTYAFKRKLDINPADVEQFYWSSIDPDVLFYVDNREASGSSVRVLVKYHVSTGAKDVVKDWSTEFGVSKGYNAVRSGNDPMYTSQDNSLFGQGGRLNRNGPGGASLFDAFVFNATTGQRSPIVQMEGTVPQPTPSGQYVVVSSTPLRVIDPTTLAEVRTVALTGHEHADMLLNAAGQDVWAATQYGGPSGSGNLIVGNLATGVVKTIIGESTGFGYPPSGTHISGRAIKAPGWVAMSIIGSSNSQLLARTLGLCNIDSGKCYMVGHHQSTSGSYWAEPHVNISPSGTRMIFGSDWGGNGSQVDTYVVELPSYR